MQQQSFKKKFRISAGLHIGTLFGALTMYVGGILFLVTSNERSWGGGPTPLLWKVSLIIILFVLPTVGVIWSFFTHWAVIEVDEKEIKKSLFGKQLRVINWIEVVDVKLTGTLGRLDRLL